MVGGSDGRDEFAGAVGQSFQFQGVAAGLRAHEVSAQFVAIPPEPPVRVVQSSPDAISRARWIPGLLLTAFVSGVGVWMMPLPSTDSTAITSEPESVLLRGSTESPPGGTISLPPAPVAAASAELPSLTPPEPSVPLAPAVAPSAVMLEASDRRPKSARKHLPRPPPAAPEVRPVVSLTSAASTGSLNPVDIRRAIDPLRPHLRDCLASELERGKDIRQTVVIKMAVRGHDAGPSIPQTKIQSPRLWVCIRSVLWLAKFRGHQGYADVTFSLRLGPP